MAVSLAAGALATGCSTSNEETEAADAASNDAKGSAPTGALAFDSAKWSYDADNDVYYQIGASYCEKPQASDYETLAVMVPGAYLDATENGDGTYTATLNANGSLEGYTATTAPVVMPINTAGYSAQPALTSYSYEGVSEYLKAGFVYVYAGCRGRENGENSDGSTFEGGAPWGVTDLKAAVRYLRYNDALIPGNKEAIFSFGHSGGGAQSAVLGASGDSMLYEPYLKEIGAALTNDAGDQISDSIAGAMCWCPITSLDAADAAYEWMMGQYSTEGTRADGLWTAQLSKDLAAAYADYINQLGLKDSNGNALTLEEGGEGVYDAGTYYDYVLFAINTSLNNFLADTTFPYTPSNSFMADGGFGGGRGDGAKGGRPDGMPDGEKPSDLPDGEKPSDGGPSGEKPSDGGPSGDASSVGGPSGERPDGAPKGGTPPDMAGDASSERTGSDDQEATTYQTAADYIASLNGDDNWITYDEASNTATISSIGAFAEHCKKASKSVGAFDSPDRSQAENKVFGTQDEDALHFDATMAALLEKNKDEYAKLSDWDESYVEEYAADLEKTNSLGTTMAERIDMYNPLYYVNEALGGEGSANVAYHWRIHSGIEQGDTSLTTELNLACALESYKEVSDVEFAAVWGQGHTMAERTGSGSENFIAWVKEKA